MGWQEAAEEAFGLRHGNRDWVLDQKCTATQEGNWDRNFKLRAP